MVWSFVPLRRTWLMEVRIWGSKVVLDFAAVVGDDGTNCSCSVEGDDRKSKLMAGFLGLVLASLYKLPFNFSNNEAPEGSSFGMVW